MSMSRDGLLPPRFSRLHPKHQTPSFATIITGVVVGVPALFLDSAIVTDLCSIGTLFAFVLVCGGILILPQAEKSKGKFSLPYINGRYIIPLLLIVSVIFTQVQFPGFFKNFFTLVDAGQPQLTKAQVFMERIPYFAFTILVLIITLTGYIKRLSLIPVLGLISCFYLMTELGVTNWLRFVIWLIIGLVIYFTYSKKHSKLAADEKPQTV